MLQYLALADAEAAAEQYDALLATGYRPEDGETKAHTYRWIHSLRALGHVDPTVTADVPTYAVFNRAGQRSYVAYNPAATEATITFSDGFTLTVPAKAMATGCQ